MKNITKRPSYGLVNFIFRLLSVVCERKPKRPKISLLIPFSANKSKVRQKAFDWLIKYWKHELPDAEIVIGRSKGKVFCKAAAFNDAASRATGKVLVIIDADAYIEGRFIEYCADRILEEQKHGCRLWYVPYRHLYRLNRKISKQVVDSDPENPLRIPSPPPPEYLDDKGHKSMYGHRYGAMCMVFPREALDILGCFDERFKGWGGEDVALLRALDTLYAMHKTTDNDILHLWHPFIGHNYKTRKWKGQKSGEVNSKLANAYHRATRHPTEMRKLVDKGCRHRKKKK